MLERFIAVFDQINLDARLIDLLDVRLVEIIIYSELVRFRSTASRRALTGLFALGAVYFTARALDLYLTSLIFHTGFAVLLVLLVVVFQEDLRRMLEGVATWGLFRPSGAESADRTNVDMLVEAVFHLAATRQGALVVLPGREALERHLSGGIQLNGKMSLPLLYSLFDPSSPGHDGAVVVRNARIERFGVHLPISKNQEEIAGRGTRHSAGLGLSESCDALTIVVSEERGVVSVAESGTLREVRSAGALKSAIEEFWRAKYPETERRQLWSRLLWRNWPLKVTAVALAVLLWFAFAYAPDTIQRTFVVPIQYANLPAALDLEDGAPHEARLTLSGSERNFRFLEPGTLKISVDLTDVMPGEHDVGITDRNLRLPVNLSLYRVEPRILRLQVHSAAAPATPEVPISPE